MSVVSASGGASALNGSAWTIVRSTRAASMSSISAKGCLSWSRRWSVVGVRELGVAVLVERTDALGAIGMHGRAPMGFHHDRHGLLDRLPLSQAHRLLDGLHRRGGVRRDLLGDLAGGRQELGRGMQLVDHAEAVGLRGGGGAAR